MGILTSLIILFIILALVLFFGKTACRKVSEEERQRNDPSCSSCGEAGSVDAADRPPSETE
ncbi:MAG: hypothetical protein AABY87_02020 [bacterium]